jgi:hypothetical protein
MTLSTHQDKLLQTSAALETLGRTSAVLLKLLPNKFTTSSSKTWVKQQKQWRSQLRLQKSYQFQVRKTNPQQASCTCLSDHYNLSFSYVDERLQKPSRLGEAWVCLKLDLGSQEVLDGSSATKSRRTNNEFPSSRFWPQLLLVKLAST